MMLVLSRKKGEAIQIADNIVVTIADIRGGRVRLSIDAPRSVPVFRQEVLEQRDERLANEQTTDDKETSLLLAGSGDYRN